MIDTPGHVDFIDRKKEAPFPFIFGDDGKTTTNSFNDSAKNGFDADAANAAQLQRKKNAMTTRAPKLRRRKKS